MGGLKLTTVNNVKGKKIGSLWINKLKCALGEGVAGERKELVAQAF
jgi:hypothetical protein